MDNESIKKNIIDLRMKYGLSQTEMAAKLGISRTAYRNLESGSTHMFSDNLVKLANVFQTSAEEILLGYRPDEGGARRLTDVRQEYLDRRRAMEEGYEQKVSEMRAENATLQGYVDALKEVIRSKDEIIEMLRSYK